jgi:hypothetical protein
MLGEKLGKDCKSREKDIERSSEEEKGRNRENKKRRGEAGR